MEKTLNTACWNGFSASIPGSGHIRRGIPCQDASLTILGDYPAVIVCDGRGSASLSHFGAQAAVAAFRRQCAVMSPFLANILDAPAAEPELWTKFCRIIHRTLAQVKQDLAAEHGCEEKEFDFTVSLAVAGKEQIGCFQIGDGALVLMRGGTPVTVFPPDKGEFSNQTRFLKSGGEIKNNFHASLIPAGDVSGIAASSDGPEHLMFQLPEMTPGRVFEKLFSGLAAGELTQQDLMDYLTRRVWDNDPRGADDRSLALLARTSPAAAAAPVPETAADDAPAATVEPASETAEDDASAETADPVPETAEDDASVAMTEPVPVSPDSAAVCPAVKKCSGVNRILLAVCIVSLLAAVFAGAAAGIQYRARKNSERRVLELERKIAWMDACACWSSQFRQLVKKCVDDAAAAGVLLEYGGRARLLILDSIERQTGTVLQHCREKLKNRPAPAPDTAAPAAPVQTETSGTDKISTEPPPAAPDAGSTPAGSTNFDRVAGGNYPPAGK